MKSIESMLNGTPFDETVYPPVELTDEEVTSIQRRLHRTIDAERRKQYTRRITAVAACICCVLLASQTSLAEQIATKFLQIIRFDSGVTLYQTEEPPTFQSTPVPEALLGKFYDHNGDLITVLTNETGPIYTADGERIVNWESDGTIRTEAQENAIMARYPRPTTVEEMDGYLCFTPYLPTYLPEGYKLEQIQLFQEKDETDGEYVHLMYTNDKGERLYLFERFLTPENIFATGSNYTIKEVTIRGQRGAEIANDSLIWDEDGISIQLVSANGALSMSEVYRIAESLRTTR